MIRRPGVLTAAVRGARPPVLWTWCLLAVATLAGALLPMASPSRAAHASSCVTESPSAVVASSVARACGSRVEILAGRSEYTQVFANPDGTSTFTATAVPARVRRADGTWAGVDTRLRTRADGSVAPTATVADVRFSGGGSGPFVVYRQGSSTLTLSWPSALPAVSIDGDTANYVDVLPGVDLRLTATATGFRHVLVVKTAAAAANKSLQKIRYQVGGDVVARSAPGGRVRFVNGSGNVVAMTATASMWDSAVDPAATGQVVAGADLPGLKARPPAGLVSTASAPGLSAASAALDVGADPGNGLLVSTDTRLLTGPNTVFPVFIDPQIGLQRTKWAYANNINSNWDVGGQAWVGMNPYDGTLYRSFFDFPTTYGGQTYKGKQILSASFSIELYHSWSCTDTWAHLYRVGAITVSNGARMSWTTRPLGSAAKWLDAAAGHANKAGGCGVIQPDMLMTFGNTETMRADVQAAATANWSTYTVGICACNAQNSYESSQDRWKRFLVDTHTTMSVTYNNVPGVPANLSPHQGQVGCGGMVGTYATVLQAQYVDADTSDTLSATFNWQQLPSGTVNSVAGTSSPANNYGTATLNLGSAAEGQSYQFQVRTYDGHAYSDWSPWCMFTVSTALPPAPKVTPTAVGSAPVYSECDPTTIALCVSTGGPGVAGGFTFSVPTGPAGQNVIKYVYGWDAPSAQAAVTAGSPYGPLLLTPPHYGINTLVAYTVDSFGRESPTTAFKFLVSGPAAPVAHWPLDTIDAHDFHNLVGTADLVPDPTNSDVTWVADTRLVGASTVRLDADASGTHGWMTASGTGLDTSGSFSVSAWVRLATTACPDNLDVVSVDGSISSAFMIGYSCWSGTWRMRVADVDSVQVNYTDANSTVTAVAQRWTHLVGVWDEAEHSVRLYVDGVLAASATPSSAWLTSRGAGWNASGPVVVGREMWAGFQGGYMIGEIADVRLWNRVVEPDDIWGTDADPATGVPAQMGLLSPPQVGAWQFRDGECYCTDTLDDSPFGRRLFLTPNWGIDPGWSGDPATTPAWLTADSHDGDGGLQLDGATGFASTTDDNGTLTTSDDIPHAVLRTDQSLTVSAWVNVTAMTGSDQVVASQGSATTAAVKLFLCGPDGKWAFAVSTPNAGGGYSWITATSDVGAEAGAWVHLVGEFDAAAGQVRLYVNGAQQASTMSGGSGWPSAGSLLVGTAGAATYFGGVIDQVRAWQGLLNAREVMSLYQTT